MDTGRGFSAGLPCLLQSYATEGLVDYSGAAEGRSAEGCATQHQDNQYVNKWQAVNLEL